jgi:hypothetical protein
MSPTVLYEITAAVNAELIEKYEKYMRERHIPDLLATGRFIGAKFTRSSENRYRIVYEAHDQKSLDNYLEKEAAILRADFQQHFPSGVELSRENWIVLQEWRNE